MEVELSLKALRKIQQHIAKRTCKQCIFFKRETKNLKCEFFCTTRNNPHYKLEPLKIKPNSEACALYNDVLKRIKNII